MYEIMIQKSFAAAHAIRLPDGSLEPLHGHNWPVEVTIESEELDAIETVMDFHVVEKMLDLILSRAHNRNLNDIEPFIGTRVNPTAERVAWWIATQMQESLNGWGKKSSSTGQGGDGIMDESISSSTAGKGPKIKSVRVGEAPGCYATFIRE